MAKYAQLVATGLPSGVLVTIKDSNGRQVPNLFPSADATAPDNRARTANASGVLSPATYLPNGTYTVAYFGGTSTVTVAGASGVPAATPFDMATQTELDDQGTANAGAYVAVATKTGDLSGGNITLTAVDVAARLVDLTGATATRVVTFPTGTYIARVTNSTDYAQTLQKSGAAGSLSLAAGCSLELSVI